MNNLKKLRTEKSFTQLALCEDLKKVGLFIDRTTYSKYENGSREMSAGVLIKLSDYFGTSVDYILGRTF